MMNNFKSIAQAGYVVLALLSCGTGTSCDGGDQMKNYIKTVKSGIDRLPWPKEMEALFGEGDHFITHFGFDPGPKDWQTEVYFGGRYRLTLQVEIDIDYKTCLVKTNVSAPKFYLLEVESIVRKNGGIEANLSGQWILDKVKWKRLVDSNGDWLAVGLPIRTNSPVPGFEDYVKGWRAPRVKIPH
jgi:hypothetical protein